MALSCQSNGFKPARWCSRCIWDKEGPWRSPAAMTCSRQDDGLNSHRVQESPWRIPAASQDLGFKRYLGLRRPMTNPSSNFLKPQRRWLHSGMTKASILKRHLWSRMPVMIPSCDVIMRSKRWPQVNLWITKSHEDPRRRWPQDDGLKRLLGSRRRTKNPSSDGF